jgi:hypothetical protein
MCGSSTDALERILTRTGRRSTTVPSVALMRAGTALPEVVVLQVKAHDEPPAQGSRDVVRSTSTKPSPTGDRMPWSRYRAMSLR